MTFSEFADWVTVVSGCMTIFGLGGLFSWSIFGRGRGGLSATVFEIFRLQREDRALPSTAYAIPLHLAPAL